MLSKKKVHTTEEVAKEFWAVYQRLNPPERKKEHLWIMLLDVDLSIVGIYLVKTITPENGEITLREVFMYPCYFNTPYFILCHNHPNGWTEFSKEDLDFTKNTKEWAEKLGFQLLDHIIITEQGFYSSFRKKVRPRKKITFTPFRPHRTNLKEVVKIFKSWFTGSKETESER